MNEVVLSSSTQPRELFRDAPRFVVYDPSKCINNPVLQLDPFGCFAEVYHEIEDLKNQIRNAQIQQLFLLLILPDYDDVKMRLFLMRHIPDQAHLHSLFLIFHNGHNFHDRWVNNTESMLKLRWCRSFTFQLFRDIREACRSACNENITYYDQRMIIAQDAIHRDSTDAAKAIVAAFAAEKKKFCLFVCHYLTKYE